jgi:flagellar biogenesis protein FliO
MSLAARRTSTARGTDGGALRVVGRASLGPKQSVYLLRAGDQVLIVGTGPAGPPTLLGSLTPDDVRPGGSA